MSIFNIKRFEECLKYQCNSNQWNILYFDSVDSTSSEIMRRIQKGEEEDLIIVAGRQNSGRGRSGNSWYSNTLGNLYISTSLTMEIEVAEVLGFIPLAAGVSIVSALKNEGIKVIKLKWPNDIMCRGKKLGGILCETPGISKKTKIIVGLGVNTAETVFPNELQEIAISLPVVSKKKMETWRIAANWICELEKWRLKILSGMTSCLIESWVNLGEPFGRRVRIGSIEGITVKLNEFGRLQIKKDNGTMVDIPGGVVENIGL